MSSKWKRLLCYALSGLCVWGILLASEQLASERAMELVLKHKDEGYVNVRGERRGYLADKGELKQRIKMLASQSYLAVVAGDDDIGPIQLKVLDEKGVEVAISSSQEGSGSNATLTYVPPIKGKFTFLLNAADKGGYYQLSIVTK